MPPSNKHRGAYSIKYVNSLTMYSHSLYRAACLVSDLPIHTTVFVSGISSEKRCSLEGWNGLQVKGDVHILQVRAVIVIIINEHLRYIKIISN